MCRIKSRLTGYKLRRGSETIEIATMRGQAFILQENKAEGLERTTCSFEELLATTRSNGLKFTPIFHRQE